jgi:hypothetical protein
MGGRELAGRRWTDRREGGRRKGPSSRSPRRRPPLWREAGGHPRRPSCSSASRRGEEPGGGGAPGEAAGGAEGGGGRRPRCRRPAPPGLPLRELPTAAGKEPDPGLHGSNSISLTGDREGRRAAGEGGGTACRPRRLCRPPPVGEGREVGGGTRSRRWGRRRWARVGRGDRMEREGEGR